MPPPPPPALPLAPFASVPCTVAPLDSRCMPLFVRTPRRLPQVARHGRRAGQGPPHTTFVADAIATATVCRATGAGASSFSYLGGLPSGPLAPISCVTE